MDRPISVQNVNGNVTVTIIEGNNNKTELSIDAFTKRFAQDCGLRFIYNDCFKQNTDTSTDFQDWLKGFQFNIKSIYHGREYRRENLLKDIKAKLEEKQRLILLGESGTSKSVILIEIMCDYLKEGYKILHNLESGSMESSSSEIKNLEFIEDTLLALVESGEKILVIVDNVHNKTISNMAIEINPQYADAYNNKGNALSDLGRNEEALPLIQKVPESDSNNEYYLSTAAFIMHNLGKYDEAKNYYNKALDINPNLKDILSESELKAFNSVMK